MDPMILRGPDSDRLLTGMLAGELAEEPSRRAQYEPR